MDLIMIVLWLAVIGVIVGLVTTYIPMQPVVKTIIHAMTAIFMILWLIHQFSGSIPNVIR